MEEMFRRGDLLAISGEVTATLLHTYAKMYEIVHLKYVQLCLLYLNKAVLKNACHTVAKDLNTHWRSTHGPQPPSPAGVQLCANITCVWIFLFLTNVKNPSTMAFFHLTYFGANF